MEIRDFGEHMAIYDGDKRITPNVDRITYNEGLFFCKDSIIVRMPLGTDMIRINLNFCINEETKDLNGSVYNSYFRNTDYIGSISNYDKYKKNLDHRVKMDYSHVKRDELNSSKIKHWRFRK